jgi:hypothetical protein
MVGMLLGSCDVQGGGGYVRWGGGGGVFYLDMYYYDKCVLSLDQI